MSMHETLRAFPSARLEGIVRLNDSASLRLAAGLELIGRTDSVNMLVGYACALSMPAFGRDAAWQKAVELTDGLGQLIQWSCSLTVPGHVAEAAGMKALAAAKEAKNTGAIKRLCANAVAKTVRCAASDALGRTDVLSSGTVRPPAGATPKQRSGRAMLAR